MQITKLTVKEFKGQRPAILLSDIAGPNGCGKTSVLEAIMMAIGDKKAKGKRGRKCL